MLLNAETAATIVTVAISLTAFRLMARAQARQQAQADTNHVTQREPLTAKQLITHSLKWVAAAPIVAITVHWACKGADASIDSFHKQTVWGPKTAFY